jgi:mutual gliding-motility protein MglA
MPTVNHHRREVLLKLVYYGPGLGGKTTNLELIHARSRPEFRGKLLSLNSDAERTLFFDLLPVELGTFKGYSIRLHLCTVPGQARYDHTRQLILRNVDGVVFVVDSQPAALEANAESLLNLRSNLRLQGIDPDQIPVVVQYNKRDLPGVLEVAELRSALGVPAGVPEFEAVATRGGAVFDTLKAIVKECLKLVGDPAKAPSGRSPSIMPGQRASMYPGALAGSSPDGAGPVSSHLPPAPRVPEVDE